MKRLIVYVFVGLSFCFGLLTDGMAFSIKEGEMNGIAYMHGGVGINERALMVKKEGRPYNLKIIFAEASGNYLADIEVVINDAMGNKLFRIVSDGPWLYVDLPPGEYKFAAIRNDNAKTRKIAVSNYLKKIMFHWRR
jgi:hypothetical protein